MTDEQLPRPRGRPPKGRQRHQMSLYLYQEELDAIDAVRGEQDRNAWIRQAIKERLRQSDGNYTDPEKANATSSTATP